MQRAFSGSFKLLQSHWNSITTLVVGESEENNCYKLLQCHALFRFFDDVDPPFPINPLMRGRDRDPMARVPDLVKSTLQREVFGCCLSEVSLASEGEKSVQSAENLVPWDGSRIKVQNE